MVKANGSIIFLMTGARPFSHTQYAPCPGNFLSSRKKYAGKPARPAVIVGKLVAIDRDRGVAHQTFEKSLFL
jgi:hypothetical protein